MPAARMAGSASDSTLAVNPMIKLLSVIPVLASGKRKPVICELTK